MFKQFIFGILSAYLEFFLIYLLIAKTTIFSKSAFTIFMNYCSIVAFKFAIFPHVKFRASSVKEKYSSLTLRKRHNFSNLSTDLVRIIHIILFTIVLFYTMDIVCLNFKWHNTYKLLTFYNLQYPSKRYKKI